jgi:hypothetical protein
MAARASRRLPALDRHRVGALSPRHFFDAKPITIPFAISVFPGELYQAPRSWAERAYPRNLIHYNRLDRGGHFAAWEQPGLFAAEMRSAGGGLAVALLVATRDAGEALPAAAGVDVTLEIGEGLPHVYQLLLGTPEAAEATEQIGTFLRARVR